MYILSSYPPMIRDAKRCFDALPSDHIQNTNLEFVVAVNLHRLGQVKEALKYYKMYLENPQSAGQNGDLVSCRTNMVMLLLS